MCVLLIIGTAIFSLQFFSGKKEVLAATTSPHFPSIKTWNGAVGDGWSDFSWTASHYDWMNTSSPKIEEQYALNPTVTLDKYFHWLILNLIEESNPPESYSLQPMKWYETAIASSIDWEDGFYHLGGDSADTDTYVAQNLNTWGEKVDAQVRYVFRNTSSTNYSNQAWSGGAGLTLTAAGDSLYFGRLDRFDEINLEFSTFSGNWSAAWEYWNGSSWTGLPNLSDGTSGGRQNGKVTFFPPNASQWKRTKVNSQPTGWGSQGVYFIRLRSNGSGGPTVAKAQGRHYWIHNGTSGNTVPSWSGDDPDGDGYIANPPAGKSAKFKYEARLPHFWAWTQFGINVNNPNIQQLLPKATADIMDGDVTGSHKYIGAFLDDMITVNLPSSVRDKIFEAPGLSTDQFNAQWLQGTRTLVSSGSSYLHSRGYQLGGNVGWEGDPELNRIFDFLQRSNCTGSCGVVRDTNYWEAQVFSPSSMMQTYRDKKMLWEWQMTLYYAMGEEKNITLTSGSKTVTGSGTYWLQSLEPGSVLHFYSAGDKFVEVESVQSNTQITIKDAWSGSNLTVKAYGMTTRDKMAGLAAFMLLQNPDTSYFETWWSYYWNGARAKWFNWTPAVQLDYGRPITTAPAGKTSKGLAGAYLFYQGTSPVNHTVYARDYNKALALYRPKTPGNNGLDVFGDASKVTLPLPSGEQWFRANYDGTVSSQASTNVTLRNGEGAIFMKGSAMSGITLSKSVDKTSAKSGDTLTYTIQYTAGNKAVTNAKIEDNIPSGTTFLSAVSNGIFDGTKVIWNLGNLTAGATGQVTFQVRML